MGANYAQVGWLPPGQTGGEGLRELFSRPWERLDDAVSVQHDSSGAGLVISHDDGMVKAFHWRSGAPVVSGRFLGWHRLARSSEVANEDGIELEPFGAGGMPLLFELIRTNGAPDAYELSAVPLEVDAVLTLFAVELHRWGDRFAYLAAADAGLTVPYALRSIVGAVGSPLSTDTTVQGEVLSSTWVTNEATGLRFARLTVAAHGAELDVVADAPTAGDLPRTGAIVRARGALAGAIIEVRAAPGERDWDEPKRSPSAEPLTPAHIAGGIRFAEDPDEGDGNRFVSLATPLLHAAVVRAVSEIEGSPLDESPTSATWKRWTRGLHWHGSRTVMARMPGVHGGFEELPAGARTVVDLFETRSGPSPWHGIGADGSDDRYRAVGWDSATDLIALTLRSGSPAPDAASTLCTWRVEDLSGAGLAATRASGAGVDVRCMKPYFRHPATPRVRVRSDRFGFDARQCPQCAPLVVEVAATGQPLGLVLPTTAEARHLDVAIGEAPVELEVALAAFATSYRSWEQPPGSAARRSITPLEHVARRPTADVAIAGTVRTAVWSRNDTTGLPFAKITVVVGPFGLDVVGSPELIGELPRAGSHVEVDAWLTGTIAFESPGEPDAFTELALRLAELPPEDYAGVDDSDAEPRPD